MFVQLVVYDDILIDVLIDYIYYWMIIFKNCIFYYFFWGVREEEIVKFIQIYFIINFDFKIVEEKLFVIDGLK